MWKDSIDQYKKLTPGSKNAYDRAKNVIPGGVNQNARHYNPYPLFVKSAQGQYIWDVDQNKYCDYWMGHMALVLGHSPQIVVDKLIPQIPDGTHFGFPNLASVDLSELIAKVLPSCEMTRFSNTGAEATMYACRLARGYTGKKIIIKIQGGWHGFNPILMKSVWPPYDAVDSLGLLEEDVKYTVAIPYNDSEKASEVINNLRDDLAAVIVEPILGSGCIPADPDFLSTIREETKKVGALFILDEIITGFRISLGGAQKHYKIDPDITTFGKVLGGGLPLGSISGPKELLELSSPRTGKLKNERVGIGGGTFSGNPVTMNSGLATLTYLMKNESKVYSSLEKKGNIARQGIQKAFEDTKFNVKTSGLGSLFYTHFLSPDQSLPQNALDYDETDKRTLKSYHMALLSYYQIAFLPTHTAAISFAHTDEDVNHLISSSEKLAASQ